jgi:uncharacterized lipoprotein YehR (DUF1307 family)
MKKILQLVFLTIVAVVLTACAPSLDGTYKGKADGVEYILVVEGKDASLEINALIFGMDLEGPIDTSKKTMDLSGSMMGQDINETATYTFKDNAMILEIKGETITLEKE